MSNIKDYPQLTDFQLDNLGDEFLKTVNISQISHPYPIVVYRQVLLDAIVETNTWHENELKQKINIVKYLPENKLIEFVKEISRREDEIYDDANPLYVNVSPRALFITKTLEEFLFQ